MSLILHSQMSLPLLGLLVLLSGAAANFHEGDFIPSARRAQFGGVCHSLQGSKCMCHVKLSAERMQQCMMTLTLSFLTH